MNFKFLHFVYSLVLCSTPVSAEIPGSSGVSFRTFGSSVAPDDLYYDVKGKDTRLIIIESARSPFVKAPVSDTKKIVFYRLVTDPDDVQVREEAAVADISAAGPWPLLIFIQDPKSAKRYQVIAIADDLKAFPFPSCRFINLTAVDLFGKYGEQKLSLEANGFLQIDPQLKSSTDTETRYTMIGMGTPKGPRLLYNNNWAVRPTQRTMVFISSKEEKMHIMRITDDIGLYTPSATED